MEKLSSHYVTLIDGIDFRKISKIMSEAGFQMNHATARNVLISALRFVLQDIAEQFEIKLSDSKIEALLKSQQMHDALTDVLAKVYLEMENKNVQ